MQTNLSHETDFSYSDIVHDIVRLLGINKSFETTPNHLSADSFNKLVANRNYLLHTITEKRIHPSDDIRMLQEFLDQHNLYLPFELKKYIDEGDIIEIYSEDFVQIYRNKTFFEFCSYDMDTILSNSFDTLFRRDPEITKALLSQAQLCLTQFTGVQPIGTPVHYMQEHFANNSKIFKIEHKWCSPVVSKINNKTLGLFCSQKATLQGNSNVYGIGFVNN